MSSPTQPGKLRTKRFPVRRIVPAAIIVLLAAAVFILWPVINEARTITSLQKLSDYPMYSMTYYGDYHLDYTVNNPNMEDADGGRMCSSFLARNEKGEPLFCRNLDYALTAHPIVMVSTNAPEKNAGLAVCDLYYLGYHSKKLPIGSITRDRALLSAPRISIDGMNEYGVAMAILSVPHAEPTLDPGKATIDESAAVRLILDGAKTVSEAIQVLKGYNMLFHDGPEHFMIADGNGDSAVVEFINGEIIVVKSDTPWQIATNFILSGHNREGSGQGRYRLIEEALKNSNGVLTEKEAMHILSRVSQQGTLWSVVYNLKTGEASLALNRKYDTLYRFTLKMHPSV